MMGGVGGILITKITGYLFDHYKALGHIRQAITYCFYCGIAYLTAWTAIHFWFLSLSESTYKLHRGYIL